MMCYQWGLSGLSGAVLNNARQSYSCFGSARDAAVPTSLPTITEVFSSAVLAGGGGRC